MNYQLQTAYRANGLNLSQKRFTTLCGSPDAREPLMRCNLETGRGGGVPVAIGCRCTSSL